MISLLGGTSSASFDLLYNAAEPVECVRKASKLNTEFAMKLSWESSLEKANRTEALDFSSL